MDVRVRLNEIFSDLFDEEIEVLDEMKLGDIEDWDSLMHMQLIMQMEKSFSIKFTTDEIHSLKNMGEYIQNIQQKI